MLSIRTMKGRAKVNLKVEGEVVAKMDCVFKDEETAKKLSELNNKN